MDISRYAAFISYSHADSTCVRWLHRALETYRLPKVLVGSESPFGPVPRRLPPVFRDRDELPASGDLGQELRAALAQSRFQIVLCSPRAARSKWVNEEILSFKRMHGESRTLALIVSGEPYAGDEQECFPPALRFKLAPDGSLSDVPAEPIAADIRPGKDGRRLALLKLIAGITGLKLDSLVRRDAARRQRELTYIAAASLSIAVITIGLAIYAEAQRRVAEAQRRLADKSLEFLVNTFAIANPATENPRTITALTILDRVSKRAGTELRSEPAVSARLLATTGEIYFNLGLQKESERDLKAALAMEPEESEGRAKTLMRLAELAFSRGEAERSTSYIDMAEKSYDSSAAYAPLMGARVAELRGMVDYLSGRYATAAGRFGQAASAYAGAAGSNSRQVGKAYMNEAMALTKVNRRNEAEVLLAKAVDIYVAALGNDHVITAGAVQNRALNDFERGRYAEAERGIARAVKVYNRVLEGDHPTLASAFLLLGRIRTARHDTAGAFSAFANARRIYQNLYGPRNAAVGDVYFYAAQTAADAGNIATALQLLGQTKSIYDESYGPNDPDQAELLMARARVLEKGRRTSEAQRDCNRGVKLLIKLDPRDPTIASARAACVAMGQGNAAG